MPNDKFVLSKNRTIETNKLNIWFEHCEKEKIPYIVVSTRTKFADIRFDHSSLPEVYYLILNKHAKTMREEAISIFKKYASQKKSKYTIIDCLIDFNDIPIYNAELAANELFDLINLYLKKEKS